MGAGHTPRNWRPDSAQGHGMKSFWLSGSRFGVEILIGPRPDSRALETQGRLCISVLRRGVCALREGCGQRMCPIYPHSSDSIPPSPGSAVYSSYDTVIQACIIAWLCTECVWSSSVLPLEIENSAVYRKFEVSRPAGELGPHLGTQPNRGSHSHGHSTRFPGTVLDRA